MAAVVPGNSVDLRRREDRVPDYHGEVEEALHPAGSPTLVVGNRPVEMMMLMLVGVVVVVADLKPNEALGPRRGP